MAVICCNELRTLKFNLRQLMSEKGKSDVEERQGGNKQRRLAALSVTSWMGRFLYFKVERTNQGVDLKRSRNFHWPCVTRNPASPSLRYPQVHVCVGRVPRVFLLPR